MASVQWDRVKEIVDAFHEEAPDDLEAWLDERCGDDEALRREAESLLQADQGGRLSDEDRAADRLSVEMPGAEDPPGDPQSPLGPPGGKEGTTVGPYRLLEEIGVGGMSVVYRAERTGADFEQTVAVKLLQRRLGDEGARQRFRTERQVLASLDHPSIAQLIDGGVTEGGRPYFVMEYVDGTPITEYADANDLGLEARLDLLRQTAEALQAAHRQLVVHRDLKPSNVFVAETETGAPTVKLLDFGIAKLLGDTLPVTRPRTQTGRRPMTPACAAPEQVGGGEISTQTDVYQLGMLAYELLAGARPFDVEDASPAERERIIREERPARPSEQEGKGGVPTARLRDDLDTVVLKALRKEPDRRYASVEAFAEDLRRYRAGEPVRARPATAAYRARKFMERNARAVAGIATFVVVIVGLTSFYILQISEERNRAQREARKAEAVAGYLTDLLQSTRPDEAVGDTVTAADMLRRGRKRIDQLGDQPAVQARMLQLLGNAYRERGNSEQAAQLLRHSLSIRDSLYGGAHRSIANTIEELAHLQQTRGNYRRADSLWRQTLTAQRARFGSGSPKLWEPLNNLGIVALKKGRYAAADSLFRRALQVMRAAPTPDSANLASTLQNWALALGDQGRYDRADSLYRKALRVNRAVHSPPHPSFAVMLHNLATMHIAQGRLGVADSLLRRAATIERRTRGPRHQNTAIVLTTRGNVLAKQGRFAAAASLYREAYAILRGQRPKHHPEIALLQRSLGQVLTELGRHREAESFLQQSLEAHRHEGRPNRAQRVRDDLAELYARWGKPEKAALYRAGASDAEPE
jgi:tetratricopeptide (TPR) repeat protein/predicted Ser/Thr protein kinase